MCKTEVKHCDWRKILTANDETPADIIAALDTYFEQFAEVGTLCPGCGSTVFADNFMEAMLTQTFEWGLCHGHGHCRQCGWPAVLYHFINDADGKEVATLHNVGLIVHPDYVEKRSAKKVSA